MEKKPFEEDINAFKDWQMKMGLKKSLNDESLKRLFSSGQNTFLHNLINRIRPKQDVKDIKKNIACYEIRKYSRVPVSSSTRKLLPIEMQRYIKMSELNNAEKDLKKDIEELKKKYKNATAKYQAKRIELIKLSEKRDNLLTKTSILEENDEALAKKIQNEENLGEKLKSLVPTVNKNEIDDHLAMNLVKNSLESINNFYEKYLNVSDENEVNEGGFQIIEEVRLLSKTLPMSVIWNKIIEIITKQSEQKILLPPTDLITSLSTPSSSCKKFELSITEFETTIVTLIAKYYKEKKKYEEYSEKYSKCHAEFVKKLQKKIPSSSDKSDIELYDKYATYFHALLVKEYQEQYLKNEISKYSKLINTIEKGTHRKLIESVEKMYVDIEFNVKRIYLDIEKLSKVMNELIEWIQTSSHAHSLFEEQQIQQNLFMCKNENEKNFDTDLACESLEITQSSMLCSTKLYSNSSVSLETRPKSKTDLIPCYENLMTRLSEIELENFYGTTIGRAILLKPNLLFLKSPSSTHSTSLQLQQILPSPLLTTYGMIREIQFKCDLNKWLNALVNEFKIDLTNAPNLNFDFTAIIKKKQDLIENISESLDKIDKDCVKTKKIIETIKKYYNFFLNCPLRNYVPTTELYEGKKFTEYEASYAMFYRMATVGRSIAAPSSSSSSSSKFN